MGFFKSTISNDGQNINCYYLEEDSVKTVTQPLNCKFFVAFDKSKKNELAQSLFQNFSVSINQIDPDSIQSISNFDSNTYTIFCLTVSDRHNFVSIKQLTFDITFQFQFIVQPYFDSLDLDQNIIQNHLYFNNIPIFVDFYNPFITEIIFDIETTNNGVTFPTADENKIIAIGMKTIQNKTCVYEQVLLNAEFVINCDDLYHQGNVIRCNGEAELMDAFIKNIKDCKILVTYNGSIFDLQFIYNKIRYKIRGQKSQNYLNEIQQKIHIDCYKWVHKHSLLSEQNKSLKGMANTFLKMNDVVEVPWYKMNECQPQQLCNYVMSDVNITWKLYNDHVKQFTIQMAQFLHIHLQYANICSNSDLCLLYISHQQFKLDCQNKVQLVTSLYNINNQKKDPLGAATHAFIKGLYKTPNTIYHFDVSSMYPSIIEGFNIQPWNLKGCSYSRNNNYCQDCIDLSPLAQQPHSISHISDIDNKWIECLKDIRICNKTNFYSQQIVKTLLEQRNSYKQQAKEAQTDIKKQELNAKQLSLKTLINSLYGLFGYDKEFQQFGQLYNPITSSTVTSIGKCCLYNALEFFNDQGMTNLQCDTDGVWVDCKKTDIDIQCLLQSLNSYINQKFKQFTQREYCLKFEVDGPYSSILIPIKKALKEKKSDCKQTKKQTKKNKQIVEKQINQDNYDCSIAAKKRYMVFDTNNKLASIKGFDVLKKNTNQFQKEFVNQVITIITQFLVQDDCQLAKQLIQSQCDQILKTFIESLKQNENFENVLWKLSKKKKCGKEVDEKLYNWFLKDLKIDVNKSYIKFDGVLVKGKSKQKGQRMLPVKLIVQFLQGLNLDYVDEVFKSVTGKQIIDIQRKLWDVIDTDYYIKTLEDEIEKLALKKN